VRFQRDTHVGVRGKRGGIAPVRDETLFPLSGQRIYVFRRPGSRDPVGRLIRRPAAGAAGESNNSCDAELLCQPHGVGKCANRETGVFKTPTEEAASFRAGEQRINAT
jgi:hypothetical protein